MNTHAPPVRLTERERTVLEMVADGMSIYEIEDAIDGFSFIQVVAACQSASRKLGALSPEHAIALAIRGGHIL